MPRLKIPNEPWQQGYARIVLQDGPVDPKVRSLSRSDRSTGWWLPSPIAAPQLNRSSRSATRANKQQACLVQTYTQAAEATTNHE